MKIHNYVLGNIDIDGYLFLDVVASLKNCSDRVINLLNINCLILNADGICISCDSNIIDNIDISPGETHSFTVSLNHDKMVHNELLSDGTIIIDAVEYSSNLYEVCSLDVPQNNQPFTQIEKTFDCGPIRVQGAVVTVDSDSFGTVLTSQVGLKNLTDTGIDNVELSIEGVYHEPSHKNKKYSGEDLISVDPFSWSQWDSKFKIRGVRMCDFKELKLRLNVYEYVGKKHVEKTICDTWHENQREEKNQEFLYRAIQCGDKERVDSLINKGASIEWEAKNKVKYSALAIAAECGDLNIFNYLVEKGANLHWKSTLDETVIKCLVKNNKLLPHTQEMLNILISAGVNPDEKQKDGLGPIHDAVANGDLPFLKELLKAGASVVATGYFAEEGQREVTPLEIAVLKGDGTIVDYLVDNFPETINLLSEKLDKTDDSLQLKTKGTLLFCDMWQMEYYRNTGLIGSTIGGIVEKLCAAGVKPGILAIPHMLMFKNGKSGKKVKKIVFQCVSDEIRTMINDTPSFIIFLSKLSSTILWTKTYSYFRRLDTERIFREFSALCTQSAVSKQEKSHIAAILKSMKIKNDGDIYVKHLGSKSSASIKDLEWDLKRNLQFR